MLYSESSQRSSTESRSDTSRIEDSSSSNAKRTMNSISSFIDGESSFEAVKRKVEPLIVNAIMPGREGFKG